MSKYVVGKVGDIPNNSGRRITVEGREIVLFNIGEEYFAINNRCPHEGGSLCHGKLVGLVQSQTPGCYNLTRPNEMLQCSWHGWEFDIRTGQSWCDPSRIRTRNYKVSVEPGDELVKGPYVAETFLVNVDGDYLVVEM